MAEFRSGVEKAQGKSAVFVPESKELFKDYWEQKDKRNNVKGLPLSRFEAIWESNSIMMGKGYNILSFLIPQVHTDMRARGREADAADFLFRLSLTAHFHFFFLATIHITLMIPIFLACSLYPL